MSVRGRKPTLAHRFVLGGRCRRCGMLASWAGASEPCPMPRLGDELAPEARRAQKHAWKAQKLAARERAGATVAVLVALLGLVGAPAAAVEREPDALLLARVCVSEAGWTCWDTGDGYAIHEAQLVGAARDGVSWRAYSVAYSPRATGRQPTTDARLSWVSTLRLDEREPQGWPPPPHAPWGAYRERWAYVLDRAREVVTWTLDDHDAWSMCSEPPTDWAAEWHTPSAGLRRIDCGGTRNRFYTRAR